MSRLAIPAEDGKQQVRSRSVAELQQVRSRETAERQQALGEASYAEAMKDFLSRDVSKPIRKKNHRLPKRSELYDRPVLRRR